MNSRKGTSKKDILRFRFHHSSHDKHTNKAFCEPTSIANVLRPPLYRVSDVEYTKSLMKVEYVNLDKKILGILQITTWNFGILKEG